MKEFFKRLAESKVLWKQMVINIFAVVWLSLRISGLVDPANEETMLATVLQFSEVAYMVFAFIYNARSGGNNPTNPNGF